MTQEEAFKMLADRLEHARRAHPVFAENDAAAFDVITDECHELWWAMRGESTTRVIDEALDVAATAMRLVMGEVQG